MIEIEEWIAHPDSGEFWAGLQQRVLRLQRCQNCGRVRFYPRSLCTQCGSLRFEWREWPASGVVYSVTTVRLALPGFDLAPPYQVALVDMDVGVRLLASVRPSDGLRIGDRVELGYRDTASGVLPEFGLA